VRDSAVWLNWATCMTWVRASSKSLLELSWICTSALDCCKAELGPVVAERIWGISKIVFIALCFSTFAVPAEDELLPETLSSDSFFDWDSDVSCCVPEELLPPLKRKVSVSSGLEFAFDVESSD